MSICLEALNVFSLAIDWMNRRDSKPQILLTDTSSSLNQLECFLQLLTKLYRDTEITIVYLNLTSVLMPDVK